MGKINLVVSDELEKRFRDAVYKKFGLKRGNITKAVDEALEEWIVKNQ